MQRGCRRYIKILSHLFVHNENLLSTLVLIYQLSYHHEMFQQTHIEIVKLQFSCEITLTIREAFTGGHSMTDTKSYFKN